MSLSLIVTDTNSIKHQGVDPRVGRAPGSSVSSLATAGTSKATRGSPCWKQRGNQSTEKQRCSKSKDDVMFSWTLRRLQCVSPQMNISQHASTDYHDSNLAVSLISHSNCSRHPVSLKATLASHPRLATCSSSHHVSRTPHPRPFSPASHVRDRSPSTVVDRLLLARHSDPPNCPSITGQDGAAKPRAQASPDERQHHCCLRQCQRAMLAHPSLDHSLAGKPLRRNAMRKLVSPTEHSDSVAMAFSLTPPPFGKDPGTLEWWFHDNTNANNSNPQQLLARRSTSTTHPTTSNITSCARLTVATKSARASKWLASTRGCAHKPHSKFRQKLFNPSRRKMLRHQVRRVVIRGNSLQQELPFLQPFLCPHVPDFPSVSACACPVLVLCLSCGPSRGRHCCRSLEGSPRTLLDSNEQDRHDDGMELSSRLGQRS